jgi:hypothetical protein
MEPNTMSEMPIMSAEQREAYEFNKKASYTEITIKNAHTIMGALAIGGEKVKPLFTASEREELESKLFALLKSLDI